MSLIYTITGYTPTPPFDKELKDPNAFASSLSDALCMCRDMLTHYAACSLQTGPEKHFFEDKDLPLLNEIITIVHHMQGLQVTFHQFKQLYKYSNNYEDYAAKVKQDEYYPKLMESALSHISYVIHMDVRAIGYDGYLYLRKEWVDAYRLKLLQTSFEGDAILTPAFSSDSMSTLKTIILKTYPILL